MWATVLVGLPNVSMMQIYPKGGLEYILGHRQYNSQRVERTDRQVDGFRSRRRHAGCVAGGYQGYNKVFSKQRTAH